jgi:hypothetical protein
MGLTLRTVLISSALVVAAGLLRPRPETVLQENGANPARFWAEQARVSASFDVVIAGDSRTFRGISPEAMRPGARDPLTPHLRIRNVGFSGACLCEPYSSYVEHALDPRSTSRTIVLGVTPHSLTSAAARDNGYLAEVRRPRTEVYERLWLSPALDFLAPIAPADLVRAASGTHEREPQTHYFETFHEDGWVASRVEPEEPDRALRQYADAFKGTHADGALVDALIATTARWKAAGIRVVAFRPPTSRAMIRLEDEQSGFDEQSFRARFTANGGEWLTFDPDAYHSYDGSHLREDGAQALSHDLADRLAEGRFTKQ